MKAAVINYYGSTDALEIAEVQTPQVDPNQVLVKVRAAAVNPKDTFIRKGRFKRLSGNQFPQFTGFDFAGEVADVGTNVKEIELGQSVFGLLDGFKGGACAEYVVADRSQVGRLPELASFEEAASLPLVSLTASQALRDEGGIKAGHHVCLNGASGGVGSMAVQIAKAFGAKVTAISSEKNHSFLYELGADHCVDYRGLDFNQFAGQFDIFFDVFGNQNFSSAKTTLTERGVWVSTVIKTHVFLSVAMTRFFGRKKAKLVVVKSNTKDLEQIAQWVDDRKLKPIVHTILPLEDIAKAHQQQETKHTRGKIVLKV